MTRKPNAKPAQAPTSQPAANASAGAAAGHLIGYARVSTGDQDTATQVTKLKGVGCKVVRTEKVSGKSREGRDELASILDFVRPGDTLVVVKLDRLGRSTRDVLNLVHELEQKGASLRVLEPAIDTGGPMGKMVLTVLGMVAEMELGFIRDRQRTGIEAAKAKAFTRAARSPSITRRSSPCAVKAWGPRRSPRRSGASGGTSTRRSGRWGWRRRILEPLRELTGRPLDLVGLPLRGASDAIPEPPLSHRGGT